MTLIIKFLNQVKHKHLLSDKKVYIFLSKKKCLDHWVSYII